MAAASGPTSSPRRSSAPNLRASSGDIPEHWPRQRQFSSRCPHPRRSMFRSDGCSNRRGDLRRHCRCDADLSRHSGHHEPAHSSRQETFGHRRLRLGDSTSTRDLQRGRSQRSRMAPDLAELAHGDRLRGRSGDLPRPGGNFYPKPARIELRASRVSRCTKHGPRAYTRLAARVPARPGGRLGKWFSWGGWKSICTGP